MWSDCFSLFPSAFAGRGCTATQEGLETERRGIMNNEYKEKL